MLLKSVLLALLVVIWNLTARKEFCVTKYQDEFRHEGNIGTSKLFSQDIKIAAGKLPLDYQVYIYCQNQFELLESITITKIPSVYQEHYIFSTHMCELSTALMIIKNIPDFNINSIEKMKDESNIPKSI